MVLQVCVVCFPLITPFYAFMVLLKKNEQNENLILCCAPLCPGRFFSPRKHIGWQQITGGN